MALVRRIGEHRPTIILVVLLVLSLGSLASGAKALAIRRLLSTAVSIVAYPFWKTFTTAGEAADYALGLVVDYDASREEMERLNRQIAAFLPHIAERTELMAENERLRRMLDFERSQPRLVLKPVEIIARSKGVLVIDRGSLHGVSPFMCAITEQGVAGVVTEVEPLVSQVMTLHRAECTISAMVRRNRVRGKVQGSGLSGSHICTMQNIDLKDDIRQGDEVVTSGESIFPAGYPIGKVVAVKDTGSLLKLAVIEPAVDFTRLDEVFLVTQAQDAAEALSGTADAPGAEISVAPEMPDDRPIQQRYAP